MKKYSIKWMRYQLQTVEANIEDFHEEGFENYYWKWKRHYLIQRITTRQIQEFNRD